VQAALHVAAAEGRDNLVSILLEGNVDANAEVDYQTPLHRAAEGGHCNVATVLLKANADINRSYFREKDMEPGTVLVTAVRAGQSAIISFLLENGAEVMN